MLLIVLPFAVESFDFQSLVNDSLFANCRGPTQLSEVFESFSPYLYPFTIEYSILVGKLNVHLFQCSFLPFLVDKYADNHNYYS